MQSNSFKEHYKFKYGTESQVVYNFSKSESQAYIQKGPKQSLIYSGNIGIVQNFEEVISLYFLLRDSSFPINSIDIYGEGSQYMEMKKYSEFVDIKFFEGCLQLNYKLF